jgi:hypothetical protein
LNQSKTSKVLLLGENVLCQYAEHKCQGVYHCDQLDMTLLSDCKRYEPDENAKESFLKQSGRSISSRVPHLRCGQYRKFFLCLLFMHTTIYRDPCSFYNSCQNKPCLHVHEDGNCCDGKPVLRCLKKVRVSFKDCGRS